MAWTWSEITPGTASSTRAVRDIVFANATVCIAVGDRDAGSTTCLLYRSTDAGASFALVTAPEFNNWRGLAYAPPSSGIGTGSGRYFAVASAGTHRGMYSDDLGVTWTLITTPSVAGWQSVTFDSVNNWFTAVASSSGAGVSRVMTGDGATMTSRAASAAKTWTFVKAHGSVTIAAHVSGGTDCVMTSGDGGINWAAQTTPNWTSVGGPSSGSSGIAFLTSAGLFGMTVRRASDSKYRFATTPTGVTWTEQTVVDDTNNPGCPFAADGAGMFGMFDQAGTNRFNYSTDGVTWADANTGINRFWDCTGWGEAALVVLCWNQNTNGTFLRGVWAIPPALVSLAPVIGSTAGGTAVTLTGTNFTGSPAVTFDGTPATSIVVVNSTTITCIAPAHAAGLVDVAVDSSTLTDAYTYTDAPILTSISPTSGPILGGTAVTITGENFSSDMTLVITDSTGQVLHLLDRVDVSDTSITGTMPAHAAGLVSLEAENADGTDTLDDCYTYVNDFTAGSDIFGAYALLRQDPILGVTEQTNGPTQIRYGAHGIGTRPQGLSPIKIIDPISGDVLGNGLNLEIAQEWMDGPKTPASPLPNVKWNVLATDRRWLLNRKVVTGVWDSVSGTTVVQEALANFAPAFSAAGVQIGLDAISISAKRDKKCADFLDAVCEALGGADWFVDSSDVVHLGFNLESSQNPDPVTDTNLDLLRDTPIVYRENWAQIRNRIHVRGKGVQKQQGTYTQQLNFNGPGYLLDTMIDGPGAGDMDFVGNAWVSDYITAYVLKPSSPLPIFSVRDAGAGVAVISVQGRIPFTVGESITISGVVGSVPDINGVHTVTDNFGIDFRILFTLTSEPVPGSGGTVVTNEPTGGLAIGTGAGRLYTSWSRGAGYSATGNAISLKVNASANPQVLAIRFFRAKQLDPNIATATTIFGKAYYTVGDLTDGVYDPSNNGTLLEFIDTLKDDDLGDLLNPTAGSHPFNTESSYEIWATVDDAVSQALVAARLGGDDDGVIEAVIDDPSLSTIDDVIKRGQAELDLFSLPIKTVIYPTKDRKSRRGRLSSVHLSNPPIDNGSGGALELKIQEVRIDQIHDNGVTTPRFVVTATSVMHTLADLLKRAQLTRTSSQSPSGASSPGTVASNPGVFGDPVTPLVQSAAFLEAQTAAVAAVAAYLVGSSDVEVILSSTVNVTTSTTHSFSVQVDYTDETNTPRTVTLTFSMLNATLLSVITNVTGVGPYESVLLKIRCKAGTTVTMKTTGTFTTVTYNVSGSIVQVGA